MRDLAPMGDAAMRLAIGDLQNRKLPLLLSVEFARFRRYEPGESTDIVRLPIDPFDARDLMSSSVLLAISADVLSLRLDENMLEIRARVCTIAGAL